MKISFDLDDLLICGANKFEIEPRGILHNLFSIESLRAGTIDLFRKLKSEGHQVCIYTSSLRSPFRIWLTFKLNGLTLDGIYNKTLHDRTINSFNFSCSKYPPMFGIDLHIDDSEGLRLEGEKYNFNTIIISGTEIEWTEKVLSQIRHFRTRN